MRKLLVLACAAASACYGQQVIAGEAEGKNVSIQAELYTQERDIVEVLGQKLEKGIVVASVTVTPIGDEPVEIWHDDFFLHSQKDGQRSGPYDPGQIAGGTVLVVTRTKQGVALEQQETGPVWGDPRIGRRIPTQDHAGGVGTITEDHATSRIDSADEPENELLKALREHILPEEEITEPITGLLYFPLDGNHNPRQLWLHYRGGDEEIDIRFERRRR